MVGGSTRIPDIQARLVEYFGGKKPSLREKLDLAVAEGATIVGNMIMRGLDTNFEDVTPLDIGVEVWANDRAEMDVVIPKNSPYNTTMTKQYITYKEN